jgi:hypothetical protein
MLPQTLLRPYSIACDTKRFAPYSAGSRDGCTTVRRPLAAESVNEQARGGAILTILDAEAGAIECGGHTREFLPYTAFP